MNIGERLRTLRKRLGLSQREFMQRVSGKADSTYIGRIERGRQYPSLKLLEKIGKAFSVPLSYFFQESEVRKVRNKLKLALIALVLSISALALAGWGQMDIQKMKRAIASSKEINALISQQKVFADQMSKVNEKLNLLITKTGALDLIEYDLCSLREKKILPCGFLGVELEDLPEGRGVLIEKVYPNYPAQAAGLEKGDIILWYQGSQCWSKKQLICDIERSRPLAPVEIDILREGQRKRFSVILVAK